MFFILHAIKHARKQASRQALRGHSVGAMPWRGLFPNNQSGSLSPFVVESPINQSNRDNQDKQIRYFRILAHKDAVPI